MWHELPVEYILMYVINHLLKISSGYITLFTLAPEYTHSESGFSKTLRTFRALTLKRCQSVTHTSWLVVSAFWPRSVDGKMDTHTEDGPVNCTVTDKAHSPGALH